MGRINTVKIALVLAPFLILLFSQDVSATGWWGSGVKSDNWILKNGGALIRFEIVNSQGESNEYKALLTRSGKKIEVELGKQGLFDEARNNRYKVTFYRGGDGLKSFDNLGNKIASKSFDVHKGESIKLRLNYKTKKISFETTYAKLEEKEEEIAKVPPKKTPAASAAVPQKNMAEESKEIDAEIVDNAAEKKILEENLCFSGIFKPIVCQDNPFPLEAKITKYVPEAENAPRAYYLNMEKINWSNIFMDFRVFFISQNPIYEFY